MSLKGKGIEFVTMDVPVKRIFPFQGAEFELSFNEWCWFIRDYNDKSELVLKLFDGEVEFLNERLQEFVAQRRLHCDMNKCFPIAGIRQPNYPLVFGHYAMANQTPVELKGLLGIQGSHGPTNSVPPAPKTAEVKSDGGSSSYYQLNVRLPADRVKPLGNGVAVVDVSLETGDLIRALVDNDFDLGNIIKACRRMHLAKHGKGKAGTSVEYDANKIGYFRDEWMQAYQLEQL